MKQLNRFFLVVNFIKLTTLFFILSSPPLPGQTTRPAKTEILDITNGFLREKKILLSEVCSGIEYIRLETGPDFFIKNNDAVVIGNKYIVIADLKFYQAFLFSRDGKFIKQLGRIGKGPGEFVAINNVTLSPDESRIALFDPGRQRVILYSTGSEDFEEIAVTGSANEVMFGTGHHLLASYGYPLSATNSNCQFAWIDIRDQSRESFGLVPEYIRNWGNMQVPLINNRGELFVDQLYNDTIYQIGHPGTLVPYRYFEIRKNRLPSESYRRPENLINHTAENARYSKWIDTVRWIFLNGSYFNKVRHMVYDRQSRSCFHVPYLPDFHDALIENDIDGGPPCWFRGITVSGDPFNIIHPYKILEYRDAGLLNRHSAKDQAAAKSFQSILSKITDMDNPIIFIFSNSR